MNSENNLQSQSINKELKKMKEENLKKLEDHLISQPLDSSFHVDSVFNHSIPKEKTCHRPKCKIFSVILLVSLGDLFNGYCWTLYNPLYSIAKDHYPFKNDMILTNVMGDIITLSF